MQCLSQTQHEHYILLVPVQHVSNTQDIKVNQIKNSISSQLKRRTLDWHMQDTFKKNLQYFW